MQKNGAYSDSYGICPELIQIFNINFTVLTAGSI
jgi:hypothetical protein